MSTLQSIRRTTLSCMGCLRDISRFRKRSKCLNCVNDQFCRRCMINGWCKNCYIDKKIICPICHRPVEAKKDLCRLCGIGFCHKCGINKQCKNCHIKNESESLIDIITKSRKDISTLSISIIVDYCIGYIVPCCNQREMCKNTILFRNKYEFLISDPQRIYRYSPKFNKANTVRMYMMNLRIFCTECTSNKIKPCLNKYGAKCDKLEICGNNQYGNICGNHQFCTNCNQRELKRECRCPDIHSIKRRWIYYTAPSTTINQCILCNNDFCTECIKYNKLFCKQCTEKNNQCIMKNRSNINTVSINNKQQSSIEKRPTITTITITTSNKSSSEKTTITTTFPLDNRCSFYSEQQQQAQIGSAVHIDTAINHNNNVNRNNLSVIPMSYPGNTMVVPPKNNKKTRFVYGDNNDNNNYDEYQMSMTGSYGYGGSMINAVRNNNESTRYYGVEPVQFDERGTFNEQHTTFNELSLNASDINGTGNQLSLNGYNYSPNSMASPSIRDWSYATTPSYNNNNKEEQNNGNYVSFGEQSGIIYDIVNNERRRGSKQYKQECIAKIMIGRAPVISRK